VPTADGGCIAEGVPYGFEMKPGGTRIFWPDADDRDTWIEFLANPLFYRLEKRIEERRVVMTAEKYEVRFTLGRTRVGFELLNKDATAFNLPLLLDYDAKGLDIAKLLTAKEGLGIPRPWLIEPGADPFAQRRPLEWALKAGQLKLAFDPSGLKPPFLVKNTTVDLSIDAGANDDWVRRSDTTWYNTLTYLAAGDINGTAKGYGGGMRFTGVSIPDGATVSVAYLTVVAFDARSGQTVRTDLCCENANNPGQIGSYADHLGRARTAAVAYDSIPTWAAGTAYQLPSIVTPVQTVVDDQSGTGDALIVFFEDKDVESDASAIRTVATFEHASYAPADFYAVYSVAVGIGAAFYQMNPLGVNIFRAGQG